MKKILLFLTFWVMSLTSMWCQTTLSGKVTDNKGVPIPGARISIKGSDVHTLSGFDGTYTLVSENPFKKVVVDYVGYKSVVMPVSNAEEISLTRKMFIDNVFIAASAGVFPHASYGLRIGYVDRFGGYVQYRSDVRSRDYDWVCDTYGYSGDAFLWTTGNYEKTRMQATAGVIARLCKGVYAYGGLGYGTWNVYWEDYSSKWARVKDFSCEGLAAETGIMFRLGAFAVSAGVSTTAFKYSELECSIGMFL